MAKAKDLKDRPLGVHERRCYQRIKNSGTYCIGPDERMPKAIQKLLARGLIVSLPGLIEDAPQGFQIV